MQNWEKQGRIYSKRAQCPTVLKTEEGEREVWRIFFADRNDKGQSFIRYLDVSPDNPKEILFEEKNSLLPYGPPGSFDHSGIMPTSVVQQVHDGQLITYLFYIGWSQRQDVPYHNAIGLAASYDGKHFTKVHAGPVIGTSAEDPFFTGTACVVPSKHTPAVECYYLSCSGWESDGKKLEPTYNIKRAFSMGNLSRWMCSGKEGVVIDFKNSKEGGICNATVYWSPDNIKHMWYCYRNKFDYRSNKENSYRIGYAKGCWVAPSTWNKGRWEWARQDSELSLDLSSDGWDSEMLCYPNVIEHKDKLYMFYNGNGFGEAGFGYATSNSCLSSIFASKE